jgi:hypothetical protein
MIRCGAVDGKEIGVPKSSSATVGVGDGCELVVVGELCPHAASSTKRDRSKTRESRKEMTRENIGL